MSAMEINRNIPKAARIPQKTLGQIFSIQVFVILYRSELELKAALIDLGKE
jgi:hypothetical protein